MAVKPIYDSELFFNEKNNHFYKFFNFSRGFYFVQQLEVFGHSGEGFSFPFLKADLPPKNNKERLDTLMVRI